MILTYQIQVSS